MLNTKFFEIFDGMLFKNVVDGTDLMAPKTRTKIREFRETKTLP